MKDYTDFLADAIVMAFDSGISPDALVDEFENTVHKIQDTTDRDDYLDGLGELVEVDTSFDSAAAMATLYVATLEKNWTESKLREFCRKAEKALKEVYNKSEEKVEEKSASKSCNCGTGRKSGPEDDDTKALKDFLDFIFKERQ